MLSAYSDCGFMRATDSLCIKIEVVPAVLLGGVFYFGCINSIALSNPGYSSTIISRVSSWLYFGKTTFFSYGSNYILLEICSYSSVKCVPILIEYF